MYCAYHDTHIVVIAHEIVPVKVRAVIICVLDIENSCQLNQVGNITVKVAIVPTGVNISLWVDCDGVIVAPVVGANNSVENAGIVVLHIFLKNFTFNRITNVVSFYLGLFFSLFYK